jgi:hypothetical protein
VDGREVHFSQAGLWEWSFDFPFSVHVTDVGSVHARLIADSAPGARPYDQLINGMSCTFTFPRFMNWERRPCELVRWTPQTSQQYPTNPYDVNPYGAQPQYAQPPAPPAYAPALSYTQAPVPYAQNPALYSQPPPLGAYGNQHWSFPVP